MHMKKDLSAAAKELKRGGVCVIPTDTIYGLVARALDRSAVERLYEIKGRRPEKPFIILIASMRDLACFGVRPDKASRAFLEAAWPGAVSVIVRCPSKKWGYLHRNKKALAFRVPDDIPLRELLLKTGPLVAPSANPEGLPPAETVREAKAYFKTSVSCYVTAGKRLKGEPSTLVRLVEGRVGVLRQGRVKIIP